MAKVLIHVEGPTEEQFVNRILYSHLQNYDVLVIPIIVTTKPVLTGRNFKGGSIPYAKAKKEIQRLLGDSSADMVTTMYDYYGLHKDFPGRETAKQKSGYEKVSHVENEFREDIGKRKFFPYLSFHEFEALLFSSPKTIADRFERGKQESLVSEILKITSKFSTPEEINDDPNTHPSQRLKNLAGDYNKVLNGTHIVEKIGLQKIRERCPHFHRWLNEMESLKST